MDLKKMRINGPRLRRTLEEMATIGATPGGGVQRLSLSNEDKEARDLFIQWLDALGLEITIDEMGNIFGRRLGKNNALAPVMSGSHIDSQPKGGRFDGILGVMGALEVFRTLHENQVETERFEDELIRIEYKNQTPCQTFPVPCYYEYHIEQGPVLERQGKIIGAPKEIVCVHWYDIMITGEANQVGPTPMEGRRDALCAAAEMILKVNQLPDRMGGNMVATVGHIQNTPNSRNVIPAKVHFTIDIRYWDDALALSAWEALQTDLAIIADGWGCQLRAEKTWP